jgi:hypothetical protein
MIEPTIELVDGGFYWIKRAYTNPEMWTVATWAHGAWWDVDGKETTPRMISGPIPRPAEGSAGGAAGEAEAALQHRMDPNPPPPHPIGNGNE